MIYTHPSHTIVLYGGVLLCTGCGSTARNKLIKLQHECYAKGPETGVHGLDNLDRYSQGRPPRGYASKWPFNVFKLSDLEIMHNIQNQVNLVPRPVLPPTPNYKSSDLADEDNNPINIDSCSSGSSSD